MYDWTVGLLVNNELERMWKAMVTPKFEVLYQIYLEGLRKEEALLQYFTKIIV
jgi:hypothetical protein